MLGKFVKIIQEDAPYNSYGKNGIVIQHDREDNTVQVRFDNSNYSAKYESWFHIIHVEEIELDFTLEDKVEIACRLLEEIRTERYTNLIEDNPEFYMDYEDELCESITSLIEDLEITYEEE